MHLMDAHREAVNLHESFTADELSHHVYSSSRYKGTRAVLPRTYPRPWTRTFSQQGPYPLGAPEVSSMLWPA